MYGVQSVSTFTKEEKAEKSWFDRNASSVDLVTENYDSEEEQVNKCRQKKAISKQLKKLQTAGVTPLLQEQLQQLTRQKLSDRQGAVFGKKGKFVVIGQDCVDALHALRSAGEEVRMDIKDSTRQKNTVNSKRKRKEEKTRLRDQRKKQKRKQNKEDEAE
ncbi:DEAD-box ATP-dependent RNA helicase 13-like [Trifolium pratense]|uniref:DEAD-box ATP-dependent RNA helicase 13-like n=1 Tax=Trifolium pratense TaxID=57577 RepID=UPI001E696624|nr:DEAD-box ATP-dependent RNA helicase 13-like [Trifolium pratense]